MRKRHFIHLSRSDIALIIVCAIALFGRFLIAPIALGDTRMWVRAGKYCYYHNPFTVYRYVAYAYPPVWLFFSWLTWILMLPYDYPSTIYLTTVKSWLILADGLTAFVIYWWIKKSGCKEWMGIVAASLYLVDPTTWKTSSNIGQLDNLNVLFLALSAYFLNVDRPKLSAAFLGVAAMTKQFSSVLVLPFLVYTYYKYKRREWLKILVSCIGVMAIIALPFLVYTWDDFIVTYLYFNLSASEIDLSHAATQGFWGVVYAIYRADVGIPLVPLIQMRYYVFLAAILLPLIILFLRPSWKVNDVYLIPVLSFLMFSPQVFHYYFVSCIPFVIWSIIPERGHAIRYLPIFIVAVWWIYPLTTPFNLSKLADRLIYRGSVFVMFTVVIGKTYVKRFVKEPRFHVREAISTVFKWKSSHLISDSRRVIIN